MITKKDREEAEAYCAEQDRQLGNADNNTQIMIVIKERDDLLNSLAATCRERDGLRQLIAELQNRITELEGKIARAKDHLESSKFNSTHIGICLEIDAALKELK